MLLARDLSTREDYAVGVVLHLVKMGGEASANSMPDSELSEATEYRVRKNLQSSGILEKAGPQSWRLDIDGEEFVLDAAQAFEGVKAVSELDGFGGF